MQENDSSPPSHLVHPKEWKAAVALMFAIAALRWKSTAGGLFAGCYDGDDVRRTFNYYCWPDVDTMCRSFLWHRWRVADGMCNFTEAYGLEFEGYWDGEDLSPNCSIAAREIPPNQSTDGFVRDARQRFDFEFTGEHNALLAKLDDVYGKAGDEIDAFVLGGREVDDSFFDSLPAARWTARNIARFNMENVLRVFSGSDPVQRGIFQERSILTTEQLFDVMQYALDLCQKDWRNKQYLMMLAEFQAVLDEIREEHLRVPHLDRRLASGGHKDGNDGHEFQLFEDRHYNYRDREGATRCMYTHHREGTLITAYCSRAMREMISSDFSGIDSMFAVHAAVLCALLLYTFLAAASCLGRKMRGWTEKFDSEGEVRTQHRRSLRAFRVSLLCFALTTSLVYGFSFFFLSASALPRWLEALFMTVLTILASYAVPPNVLQERGREQMHAAAQDGVEDISSCRYALLDGGTV